MSAQTAVELPIRENTLLMFSDDDQLNFGVRVRAANAGNVFRVLSAATPKHIQGGRWDEGWYCLCEVQKLPYFNHHFPTATKGPVYSVLIARGQVEPESVQVVGKLKRVDGFRVSVYDGDGGASPIQDWHNNFYDNQENG